MARRRKKVTKRILRKGVKKGPQVVDAVAKLQAWGFTVTRVFGDREFSAYDVIAGLEAIGAAYTGTMKKTPRVKPHGVVGVEGLRLQVVAAL